MLLRVIEICRFSFMHRSLKVLSRHFKQVEVVDLLLCLGHCPFAWPCFCQALAVALIASHLTFLWLSVGCSLRGRAGYLLIRRLVICSLAAPVGMPNVLGKNTNPKFLFDVSTGVWMLDRKHLCRQRVEKSSCMNGWMRQVPYITWRAQVEKTSAIYEQFTQWLQGAQVLSSNMLAQNYRVLDAARGIFADCMVTIVTLLGSAHLNTLGKVLLEFLYEQ